VDGSNDIVVSDRPHAAFHRISNFTASAVWVSNRSNSSLSTSTDDRIRRQRRPPGRRLEQVRDERIREQLVAVLGQKREHAALRHQIPDHHLRVQQLPVHKRMPLHSNIIQVSGHTTVRHDRQPHTIFSGVLVSYAINSCFNLIS
jgi:hypothetical protein